MVDDLTRARRESKIGMGLQIDRWTTELVDAAVRGRTRITSHGQVVQFKLDRKGMAEFEHAKVRGYVVVRYSSAGDTLRRAWFYWCDATGTPYLYVVQKRTRADVHMDLIATYEEIPKDRFDGFCKNLAVVQDEVGAKYLSCSPVFTSVLGVPLQHADRMAVEIVQFAQAVKRCHYEDRCPVQCPRHGGEGARPFGVNLH
jgi:hypothetical protein